MTRDLRSEATANWSLSTTPQPAPRRPHATPSRAPRSWLASFLLSFFR
jgi:hypothetical protein